MMKSAVFCALVWCLGFSCAYAQPLSSSELIQRAAEYDQKAVIFEGEVVGEVMRRGNYAWANINDGLGAIGVWLPLELAAQITAAGSYGVRGDWVEVSGIFNRACPMHGGDLDIHAQSLRILSKGASCKERLHEGKRNLAAIFAGVLCLAALLNILRRKPRH